MSARGERRSSAVLLAVLFFGIAMLYLPILVLIGYSFNASPLVNVWGGFSTAWYGQLLHNRQLLQAALLSLEVAVARLHRRGGARHAGGDRTGALRALSAGGCCSPAWSTRRW